MQAAYELVGRTPDPPAPRPGPARPPARHPRLRRPHGLGQHPGAGDGRPAARQDAAARQRDRHGPGRPRHRRAARARGLHAVMALLPSGGREKLGIATGRDPVPPPLAPNAPPTATPCCAACDWCARHGITSIHNMDGNPYQLELLAELDDAGELRCRVRVPFHMKNFMTLADLEAIAPAMRARWPPRPADHRLRQDLRRRRAGFDDGLHARRLRRPARQPRPAAVHASSRSTPR